jgi:hypothetical protein
MKKIVMIFTLAIGFTTAGISQVNSNAIGARLGYGTFGSGIEVSYQKGLGEKNRLELDLGLSNGKDWGGFGFAAIYHWNWNIVEGLNWYIGPGAILTMFSNKNNNSTFFNIGIGGQVGLEYDFQSLGAPLLVSLDTRPMWGLTGNDYYNRFGWGSALSIRYIF